MNILSVLKSSTRGLVHLLAPPGGVTEPINRRKSMLSCFFYLQAIPIMNKNFISSNLTQRSLLPVPPSRQLTHIIAGAGIKV
jgi:hypothetical protein